MRGIRGHRVKGRVTYIISIGEMANRKEGEVKDTGEKLLFIEYLRHYGNYAEHIEYFNFQQSINEVSATVFTLQMRTLRLREPV